MKAEFHVALSEKKFDCLSYSDPRSLSPEQKTEIVSCMDDVLLIFLRSIGYQYRPDALPDRILRQDLWTWNSNKLADSVTCSSEVLDIMLDQAARLSELAYPTASSETKLQMAMGTAAAMTIDHDPNNGQDVSSFLMDIWQQKPPSNKWAAMFTDFIRGWSAHFGALNQTLGSLGGTGWANFAESYALEQTINTHPPPHLFYRRQNQASNGCCPEGFASYMRSMTGFAIPYAIALFKPSREEEIPFQYWMTSTPQLLAYLHFGNDLFSFPKEVHESENYMALQTQSKRQSKFQTRFPPGDCSDLWTFRDTICELMTIVFDSVAALDRAFVDFAKYVSISYCTFSMQTKLTGFPRICEEPHASEWKVDLASRLWLDFRGGYIAWHVDCPQYRLDRLRDLLREQSTSK